MKFTSRTIALGSSRSSSPPPSLTREFHHRIDAGAAQTAKSANWPTSGPIKTAPARSTPSAAVGSENPLDFREGAFTPSDFSSSPAVVGNRIYVARPMSMSRPVRIYLLPRRDQRQTDLAGAHPAGSLLLSRRRRWPRVCRRRLARNIGSLFRCLDVKIGDLLWQFKTNSHAEGPPTIKDGRVYFGAGDDGLYCLDAITANKSGNSRLSHRRIPVICGDILPSAPATTAPAISHQRQDRRASLVAPHEASVWAPAPSLVIASISAFPTPRSAARPADLGAIHCVNIHNGDDIWTVKLPRAVGTSMVIARISSFSAAGTAMSIASTARPARSGIFPDRGRSCG